ncbi:MAG TPA: helix-turn-helix transcriptional regulator [Bryobacteraceae bacterium]|nr:helix-turn-helix transcriptional regulator [Bryobacteraceae bacterium]
MLGTWWRPAWADFHIILPLAGGPLHAYGIMNHVERDAGGEVALEIGSLYRLLDRLVTEGLIDNLDSADERCRHFRITAAGRKAFKSLGEWDHACARAKTAPGGGRMMRLRVRRLIRLFPAGFRDASSADMLATFDDR